MLTVNLKILLNVIISLFCLGKNHNFLIILLKSQQLLKPQPKLLQRKKPKIFIIKIYAQ